MTAALLRSVPRRLAPPPVVQECRRSRARVAVLGGVAAVIAAHLWLAVQVETEKPHWRDPEFFLRTQAAKELTKADRRPLLAILGGSRPQMGLDPAALGSETLAYNFSQSGCLPVGEYLNFTRLQDAGLEPRFVLIEVLPPVLADGGPAEDRLAPERLSSSELARLEPFQHDPASARKAWRKARITSWLSLRVPLRANAGLAEERGEPQRLWSAMSPRGWSPAPLRPVSAEERERRTRTARLTYGWLLDDFSIHSANDRAYRMILASCRERGIRAALFTMPESPLFRSWYPPAARRAFVEYLRSLAAEFEAPLFETSQWIDDEAAFLDGHHLQREPAKAFSERFARECVGPWVTR